LVLAGGTSNLIDRITRAGNVTDFITLRLGPFQTGIFNVADVIIMMGIGLLIFAAVRPQRESHS
jgi:signal peptidase II